MSSSDKVAAAATTCLAFCQTAPDPQATAARFLSKLAAQPEWSPEELSRLEAMLRERLAQGQMANSDR